MVAHHVCSGNELFFLGVSLCSSASEAGEDLRVGSLRARLLLPGCSEVCWGSAESQMGEQAEPAGRGRLATVPWEKAEVLPLGGLGGKPRCWEPQAFSWNELLSLDSVFPNLAPSGTWVLWPGEKASGTLFCSPVPHEVGSCEPLVVPRYLTFDCVGGVGWGMGQDIHMNLPVPHIWEVES